MMICVFRGLSSYDERICSMRKRFPATASASALLLLLLGLAVQSTALSQQAAQIEPRVENAKWTMQRGVVVITYELAAPVDKTYEVVVVLKKESDSRFSLIPKSVEGAIGKGKYAGGMRKVFWDYKKDVAAGLVGDDYWFEITANELIEGRSNTLYYVGGIAVVGALVAWRIITDGNDVQKLPDPPTTRPVE